MATATFAAPTRPPIQQAIQSFAASAGLKPGPVQQPANTTTQHFDVASPPNPFLNGPVTAVNPAAAKSVGPAPTFQQAYNGKVYTDPNSLAQAQVATQQAQPSFAPLSYGGKTYSDPTQYANQVITDVKATHDKAVGQINSAYQNGLISFKQQQDLIAQNRSNLSTQASQALAQYNQSQTALSQGRDQALASQQGYFQSISPDAVQSQQGVMAGQTQQQYGNQVASLNTQKANNDTQLAQAGTALDTSQQNLGTSQADYANQYQNSLLGADQAQTQGIDQANNVVLGSQSQQAANRATQQGILDAGQNAAIQFQNQVANYNASAGQTKAAATTNYDPVALAQSFAGYLINANTAGLAPETAAQALLKQATSQGLSPAQVAPIIQYAQGQVADANSPYGQAFANKTPLASSSTGF